MNYENLHREIMQLYGGYIVLAGVLAFLIFGAIFLLIATRTYKRYERMGKKVDIYKANMQDLDAISPLVAKFRVELRKFKEIESKENLELAKEELVEFINAKFPVFICKEGDVCVGYLVCRVQDSVVWVEHLYVLEEYRKKGIASALYGEAEVLNKNLGGDTLYNYVHPNNDAMIGFLNKKGYNVLNLIEVRKKYANEEIKEKIEIRNNFFEY